MFVRLKLIPNGTDGAAAEPAEPDHPAQRPPDPHPGRPRSAIASRTTPRGRWWSRRGTASRRSSTCGSTPAPGPRGADGDRLVRSGHPGTGAWFTGGEPVVIPGLEAVRRLPHQPRPGQRLVQPARDVARRGLRRLRSVAGLAHLHPRTVGTIQVNGVLGELGLEGGGYTRSSAWSTPRTSRSTPTSRGTPSSPPTAPGSTSYRRPHLPGRRPLRGRRPRSGGAWYDFVDQAPVVPLPGPTPHPGRRRRWSPPSTGPTTTSDAEDHRTIVQEVDFPRAARLEPGRPARSSSSARRAGCATHWDRTGSLQLVLNPDDPQDQWQYLELARYITPYRVGMCQHVDVTAAGPAADRDAHPVLLDRHLGRPRDTSPARAGGSPSGFVFYPGDARQADEVVNLWGRRTVVVGSTDPDRTVDAQVDPVTVHIPENATRVQARLVTSGHSFGNTGNCAEFCPLRQDLLVNGEVRSVLPWRSDCEYNPVARQQGHLAVRPQRLVPGRGGGGPHLRPHRPGDPRRRPVLDFDVRTMDGEVYVNTSPGDHEPIEWMSGQVLIGGSSPPLSRSRSRGERPGIGSPSRPRTEQRFPVPGGWARARGLDRAARLAPGFGPWPGFATEARRHRPPGHADEAEGAKHGQPACPTTSRREGAEMPVRVVIRRGAAPRRASRHVAGDATREAPPRRARSAPAVARWWDVRLQGRRLARGGGWVGSAPSDPGASPRATPKAALGSGRGPEGRLRPDRAADAAERARPQGAAARGEAVLRDRDRDRDRKEFAPPCRAV